MNILGRPAQNKAQSAMEYLMTYGWAILIIAVVLGALFSLGVFSGGTLLGTSCIAAPGFSCTSPVLLHGGGAELKATIGQNTGTTLFNAIVSVSAQGATLNGAGFPAQFQLAQQGSNTLAKYDSTGSYAGSCANGGNTVFGGTWLSGQTNTIDMWILANTAAGASQGNVVTNANLLTSNSLGTPFVGYVWVNYSTVSCATASGGSGSQAQKIATISIKVS